MPMMILSIGNRTMSLSTMRLIHSCRGNGQMASRRSLGQVYYIASKRTFTDGPSIKTSSGPLNISETETSLAEMGLANIWTPSGHLQSLMEFVHLHCDLPWWTTIVVTTACLRLVLFPLVVKAQRNMVKMNNVFPEMQRLQMELAEAKDKQEYFERRNALAKFLQVNDVNPLKSYMPMLGQGFVFCSMFFALRGMAEAPVESMKTQGALWFVDLTSCDPYFLLPILTASSVFVHLKVGADGIDLKTVPKFLQNFLLVMPWISLPIMCYFPTALNVYWFTTNLVSIVQSRLIQQPSIRKRLGIGERISWKEEDLPHNILLNFKSTIDKMGNNASSAKRRLEEETEIDLEEMRKRKGTNSKIKP